MIIADWVAQVFHNHSINKLFLYPGGTIAPLIDACLKVGIHVECFKSEQGAGYAALAYARITGKPQVVMVTSGPGVTNAISPLADAYYDSTPLILVTGQIGTGDLKIRKAVRQRGFQETPTVELTMPISKRSTCMMSPNIVFHEIPYAFRLAVTGRKGPVVIDFPMDIQRLEIKEDETPSFTASHSCVEEKCAVTLDALTMTEVIYAASQAKRPVLLLGHGALCAAAYSHYIDIAKALDAVVVTSFLGVGSYDTMDSRFIGYIGHTGHLAANKAVHECDYLLVLGSRLDVRQTGTVIDKFVPNGQIVWVDSDKLELQNPRIDIKWKIESDIQTFCFQFLSLFKEKVARIDNVWRENLLSLRREQLEDIPKDNSEYLQPRTVLRCVQNLMGESSITVVTGVGCHQHWATRHLAFRPYDRCLLTSGGHGTMGYDLPSAIGAAMAQPDRLILCVVGDGSLLMNIQEMASLSERGLNVKILVMNNSRLGIVSQFQLITWGSDPTTGDFKSPNFMSIAKGFGISADRLENITELESKMKFFLNTVGPALLDINIDPAADVVPMLLAGQQMDEMWMGRKA